MYSPNIHVETYGQGPSLVLCAGLTQTTANWRGIARQNSHLKWTLFDPRGQGKSHLGVRPYQLDDHVDDLKFVMDTHLANEKPTLVGFSHGGRVAIRAASRFPERFSRLILVNCAARTTPLRRAHVTAWAKCLELGGVDALAWASLPTIIGVNILRKFDDLGMLVKGMATRNSKEGLTAMFEGMSGYPDIVDDAKKLQCPTLIFRGALDPLVSEADCDDFEDWIQDCRISTFAECGHTLPLEEPDQFVAEITDFVGPH